MGVETSNKKIKPSDQSNMEIAIGKRKGEINELTVLVITASKLGLSFLIFFPISKFRGISYTEKIKWK